MRGQHLILGIGIIALSVGAKFVEPQKKEAGQATKLFARAKADDYTGDQFCQDCHSEKAKAFVGSGHAAFMSDPKLPASKRGCEGCHGPGQIHQADKNAEVISFRKMSPAESSAACLRCHGETLSPTHWTRSPHSKADLSCVSCHQIHPDSEPMVDPMALKRGNAASALKPVFVAQGPPRKLLAADEPTLCGQCHAPQVAEFRMSSHHPIPEGRVTCSDCHSVHPSKSAKTRQPFVKDACVTCHAEKAGPFVFEHDPTAGGFGSTCTECHKPHGTNNPKLLNSFSRGLCAQCHTDKLTSHYPGRTCWQSGCHVAIHGSNSSRRFLTK